MPEATEILNQEIRNMIAKIIEVDVNRISMDAHFVDDLGADSMMALEIMSAIEKKYKITISEDDLIKLIDLRHTLDLVTGLIPTK